MVIPIVEDGKPIKAYKLNSNGIMVKKIDMMDTLSQKSKAIGTFCGKYQRTGKINTKEISNCIPSITKVSIPVTTLWIMRKKE